MPFPIRTILTPVDFGEGHEHALNYALELAKATSAMVHVLHVYQIPVYGFPDGAFLAGADVATRLSEAAQKGLDGLLARYASHGIELKPVLRQGTPHEEIVSCAKELNADLIVIGTHGRGGFAHALLGSVAERVVRTSPVPVLTVRYPAK